MSGSDDADEVELREFFFLRHGSRLDQVDKTWRDNSPTPYDTPVAKSGVQQSMLAGQAISQMATSRKRNADQMSSAHGKCSHRFVIHTSPFLRCIQTSLALASKLIDEGSSVKPLLRIDCSLGEWMTPDYYSDIQAPPPMSELAAHARYYLAQLAKTPPSSPEAFAIGATKSTASNHGTRAPTKEEGVVDVQHVEIDWTWQSSLFGYGGEYGEEWPEMHSRFRQSLRKTIDHYCDKSNYSSMVRAQEVTLVMVTHGAGCNAMIGAVSGQPVLKDVGIASLSHAELKAASRTDSGTRQRSKISSQYTLDLSASTAHLTSPASTPPSSSGPFQSQIGRSGSWHKHLGRKPRAGGLWTSASTSSISSLAGPPVISTTRHASISTPTSALSMPIRKPSVIMESTGLSTSPISTRPINVRQRSHTLGS